MNSQVERLFAEDPRYGEHMAALWAQQQWQPHSHTRGALRYYAQRPGDSGLSTRDVSFVLLHGGIPAAAFLGAFVSNGVEANLKAYEIPALCLVANGPMPSAVSDRLLDEFDELLEQVNGRVQVRDFLQGGMFSPLALHMLRQGARLRTHTFQMIDLSFDEAALWRGLRKSYKSLVNWAGKTLRIETMDASNAQWAGMNAFRELHIRVAGRETRSIESWQRQFEWVLEDGAFLVFGLLGEELVSAGMFTFTGSLCTYFSSASRRDLFDKPMFHALMWAGMMRAKSLGCRWFDVNEKYFLNNPDPECDDQKLMSISDFKLGFGGTLKPVVDIELDRVSSMEKD